MAVVEHEFFAAVFSEVDTLLNDFVTGKAEAISKAAFTPFTIILTVYVILYGLSVASGRIRAPMADGILRIIRIAVIIGLAFNIGAYNAFVVRTITGFPDEIGKILVGTDRADTGTSVSSLDEAFDTGLEAGKVIWEQPTGLDFGEAISNAILALVIWIATFALTVYAAFLLLLSKVFTAVILALGPLFIAGTLFEQTKRLFESWIQQLLNYALVNIIAVGVLSLVIGLFQRVATGVEGETIGVDQVGGIALVAGISVLMMMQTTAIASGLAGGATLQGMGAFGAISQAIARGATAVAQRTALGRAITGEMAGRQAARRLDANQRGREIITARRAAEKNTASRVATGNTPIQKSARAMGRATGRSARAISNGVGVAGQVAVAGARYAGSLAMKGVTSGARRIAALRKRSGGSKR
jgi:type IV secretion system protein VirB6